MDKHSIHMSRPPDRVGEVESLEPKPPSLFRNYISFVGGAIVIASFVSVVLLFLIEITSKAENPYLGILTYIILPSILIFGLVVVIAGRMIERRRRHRAAPSQVSAYPKLDLNDPGSRKAFFIFLVITFLFVSASAFGSYRGYEYTESVNFCGETCHTVMKPEFTAYLAGAHARVGCVGCHVGPGASWYVRSKISGAYQLYSVTFNKYPRPITTPVHNLRPAQDTCEQCHWPEKFFGAQMKVFNRYAYDEQNTLRQRRMLINVGGGSPSAGLVTGIHWHMNIANEVTYVSIDDHRQVIPWVRIKDRSGNVTEYYDRTRPLTPDQLANSEKRRMDCIDCHNRPAHVYLPPDAAVDLGFTAGRLDPSLPYLKRQSVEVLSRTYSTTPEAVKSIATSLNDFYRTNYGDVYASKRSSIDAAVTEVQRIFQTYFFPEMKTDWQTHPNNIGHLYFSGCFRCHDGEHVSNTGKVISNNCNVCHTMIYDSAAPPEKNVKTGPFVHPVDLGALAERKCEFCHKANKPFQHPINLGDISMFQCAECHPKKETKLAPQ
ncbi:MAG TPA: NapC/NirT family cytochrome c [Pyrinomonadaceae bacterium]|nr:NapC/NirT family cytochrome c [Pyrinomonadaceae bacterium]